MQRRWCQHSRRHHTLKRIFSAPCPRVNAKIRDRPRIGWVSILVMRQMQRESLPRHMRRHGRCPSSTVLEWSSVCCDQQGSMYLKLQNIMAWEAQALCRVQSDDVPYRVTVALKPMYTYTSTALGINTSEKRMRLLRGVSVGETS